MAAPIVVRMLAGRLDEGVGSSLRVHLVALNDRGSEERSRAMLITGCDSHTRYPSDSTRLIFRLHYLTFDPSFASLNLFPSVTYSGIDTIVIPCYDFL
jgi:hypothetical protein